MRARAPRSGPRQPWDVSGWQYPHIRRDLKTRDILSSVRPPAGSALFIRHDSPSNASPRHNSAATSQSVVVSGQSRDGILVFSAPRSARTRATAVRLDSGVQQTTGNSRSVRRASGSRPLNRISPAPSFVTAEANSAIWAKPTWPDKGPATRHLLALGVPRRPAIRHSQSRKGPWHRAKTIASGVGMTNAWLQEQGLLSLKSLWVHLAPLRRTAWCRPARYVVWGLGGETRPATRLYRVQTFRLG